MPKFFSSIFFKLMVVILVTGLGINISLILFLGAFRHHVSGSFYPHLGRYIDYLIDDIGDPPDLRQAQKISAETDMIITYEGPDGNWSTSDTRIDFPLNRLRIRHKDDRMVAGRYRGAYHASVYLGTGRLNFLLPHQPDAEKKIKAISLGFLLLITLLMVGAYFCIRWVLNPLKGLKKGVDRVARGELSHRVPLRRNDELRDLSDAFNSMTERLQHLIKSKEQLLLDISHELRTPVTRMKVAMAMMTESPDKEILTEDLLEIEEKITELLETVRTLNIKVALNYTTMDLPSLIRKTAGQFEGGRPPIRFDHMPDTSAIKIDAEQIGRALKNILDNARKYSAADAASILVSLEMTEEDAVIIVKDHGIGIAEEDIDFIFEPFYRADKARTPQSGGYGLGLSMAKNIVEAHGGDIAVTSQPGQGTTIRIRLPLGMEIRGKE